MLSLSEKNFTTVKPSESRARNNQKAVAVKPKVKQEPKEDGNYSPEAKRIKVEDDDEVQNSFQEIWATCAGSQIKLFQEDKLALEFDRLNDRHINFVQTLLRNQNMFGEDITVTVDTQVQKQKGDEDCGVFCIAIAISLLHNQAPGPFTQSLLPI